MKLVHKICFLATPTLKKEASLNFKYSNCLRTMLPFGWALKKNKLQVLFLITIVFFVSCNQKPAGEKQVSADSIAIKVESHVADAIDTSAKQKQPETKQTIPAGDTLTPQKVTVQVFSNDTTPDAALKGFGYNILMDGKLYVHQPHIPAVPGNKGFANIDQAKKAGTFIKYKIEHHIMPPSVTVQELDSLQITY